MKTIATRICELAFADNTVTITWRIKTETDILPPELQQAFNGSQAVLQCETEPIAVHKIEGVEDFNHALLSVGAYFTKAGSPEGKLDPA